MPVQHIPGGYMCKHTNTRYLWGPKGRAIKKKHKGESKYHLKGSKAAAAKAAYVQCAIVARSEGKSDWPKKRKSSK